MSNADQIALINRYLDAYNAFDIDGMLATLTPGDRVRAVDAAGNLSPYSTTVSATTPTGPVPPAGLVAGYSFDAGSGTTVADVSGNGNTGTITGATWVAGRELYHRPGAVV